MRILITGSSGLIGSDLASELTAQGHDIVPFDIQRTPKEDVRDVEALRTACRDVEGIVHLAAVSRVVTAHNNPELCKAVNTGGLKNLADVMRASEQRPWLVFGSSREVYGQQEHLPVSEDAPLLPCNVYAHSKVAGEELTNELRDEGFVTAITRFSNVYGKIEDHHDRVVPAFAKTAAIGGTVRVDGSDNLLDFTSIADVTRGLIALIQRIAEGDQLPPVHFTTGRGMTLAGLAELAQQHARFPVEIVEAPPRNYDVHRFFGSTQRAEDLLGWKPKVMITEGFEALVQAFAGTSQL